MFDVYVLYYDYSSDIFTNVSSLTCMTLFLEKLSNKDVFSITVKRLQPESECDDNVSVGDDNV